MSIFILFRWAAVVACALALGQLVGCETTQSTPPASNQSGNGAAAQPTSAPLGEVKSTAKVGAAKMSLDQVQTEVEAYVDRYVLSVSQVTDEIANETPEMRQALHAVKVAIASGAYTIAAGPNPVVALLDIIVQVTLVRWSIERNLATRLPPDAAERLNALLTRREQGAWTLGERILPEQDLVELRTLIDVWIEDNPTSVYVAGIRFSDFSRLRPKEGRSLPSNIFGLLRLDPFASIDPVAKEIGETRELAERLFYYLQRMPQLVRWQTEGLYYQLVSAKETQQVLQNLDTVAMLPETLPVTLKESEESISKLLSDADATIAKTQEAVNSINATSSEIKSLSAAVTETGKVWQETANAFTEMANAFNPPDDPNAPPSEPTSIKDYEAMLKQAQDTAVELRTLLNDLNTTIGSGTLEEGVAASVAKTREGAQSIVVTITICVIVIIAAIVIGAILHRAIVSRMGPARAAAEPAPSDNE